MGCSAERLSLLCLLCNIVGGMGRAELPLPASGISCGGPVTPGLLLEARHQSLPGEGSCDPASALAGAYEGDLLAEA